MYWRLHLSSLFRNRKWGKTGMLDSELLQMTRFKFLNEDQLTS